MFLVINLVFLLIMVMLSIAFFTLMERKFIGYSQSRKGPNKVSIIGIMQPVTDAIKLLSKELNMNFKSNKKIFFMSPPFNILCSLLLWMFFPFIYTFNFMKMSMLFLMSCMTFNTMTILAMSWSSNSNYSYIGAMRSISQMVSYEVNLMLVMMILINLSEQLNMNYMFMMQKYLPMAASYFPLLILWIITILAETNRTPFDFSEGESELISGFNIEYSSTGFMMLFLAEYSSILLLSLVSTIMFFNIKILMSTWLYLMYILFCSMFIWMRTTLPRFRYDKLMKLSWTGMLPILTIMMIVSFSLKIY